MNCLKRTKFHEKEEKLCISLMLVFFFHKKEFVVFGDMEIKIKKFSNKKKKHRKEN